MRSTSEKMRNVKKTVEPNGAATALKKAPAYWPTPSPLSLDSAVPFSDAAARCLSMWRATTRPRYWRARARDRGGGGGGDLR